MNQNDLRPAHNLAKRYGVKVVLFGGPGAGKTPIAATAPRPVICVSEPGMLSMRRSNIPCWEAFTVAKFEEFMKWCGSSNETKNFDTIIFDSMSHVAELVLVDSEKKTKHGMQAYGMMSTRVMDYNNFLFYLPEKNVINICKQALYENGRQKLIEGNEVITEPIMQKRPYFPGKDLNIKMPHLFDSVWHLGEAFIQGHGNQKVIRTRETSDIFARDRMGNLNELEPPNLTDLFKKSLAG